MRDDIVNKSFWLDTVTYDAYPELSGDMQTDALVVGAGMAGISIAYLLAESGLKVTIIEGNRVFNGASGNTTAKITSQHSLIYENLINTQGFEKAKIYADANETAVEFIRNIVNDKNISCSFTNMPAYTFTSSGSSIANVEKEVLAAQKLGINASFTNTLELPLRIKAAVMFHNQAQFHPVKYMKALLDDIVIRGNRVYENSRAASIKTGKTCIVTTVGGGSVKAKYVIVASHFPFYDGLGLYFTRLYAERSYINTVTIKEHFPNGMYITAEDPVLSLRAHIHNGEQLVLLGGRNHRTGEAISTVDNYLSLLAAAGKIFTVTDNPYRWSAQDYNTPDNIPYIGKITSDQKNVFIATGFGKWGMTNSALAAMLIKDLIINEISPWESLYEPSRINIGVAPAATFIKANIKSAGELIKGKLEAAEDSITNLKGGEGRVIRSAGGKVGVYRDYEGKLHKVDITCTHLKCELHWNDAEKTWDCPCHGSRFDIDGNVIEGPAQYPLDKK